MTGRFKTMEIMPHISMLVKNEILSPDEASSLVRKLQSRTEFSAQTVIDDLYGLDIPEDKLDTFARVCQALTYTLSKN